MDFQLTPEQVDLRDATRKLCTGRFPISRLRVLEGSGFDAAIWDELAGAGVFSLRVPEEAGGLGLGMAESAIVWDELGRGLIPGPLVWTELAASWAPGAGPVVGGVVDPRGGPVRLEHAAVLDHVLVVRDSGVELADAPTLTATLREPLDPLTPVSELRALPTGTPVAADVARLRCEGTVLAAAQLAGIAGALTELTVAYTKERYQFGRPVGSFQALKHTMADMLARSELARVQVYAAAVQLDEGAASAARAAGSAIVVAANAAVTNGHHSIQCHGGMGYTWEVDSHLYLKRAWVLSSMFGAVDDHAVALSEVVSGEW